ncbi:MAG TPA: ATP-binding protein [Gammaproteobacteria bacterium]|nr:ATP-binding protein [Gammaproteobacteria bacterium]
MSRPLKLLIVEDDANDLELLLMRLREDGYEPEYECVSTAESMARALARRQDWEIVLSDYRLPNFGAPLALTVLQQTGLDIPFIIISGTIGEERAVATMRAGARDFILKHDLRRLAPIIERELREAQIRQTRRRTEQALKAAEFRYRQIVNTAQEGIWVLDAENRTTFVNKYMALILGYAEYEMIGHPLSDFLDDPATMPNEGFNRQTELKFRHKEGGIVWGLISSSPIKSDGASAYAGALGMVTNVTERKRADEEREQLVRELQQAVQARDEFLSVASHELRTPITTLKLHVQTALLMRDRGTEVFSPAFAYRLDGINRQINRLTQLIDDLLDVTRMSGKKMRYEFRDMDLAETVREVAGRFAEEVKRAKTVLRVDAPSPVRGKWDKLRIEQVIDNLISNALRHGSGTPVEVVLSGDDGVANLVVRDRGPGIPPATQEKIFERFEQGILSRKVGGLGLGLYIVKQIVDAHGGEVRVESEPGQGATFIVRLPQRQAQNEPERAGRKILIIEDDRDVVEALSGLLQIHGYEVEHAFNGLDALQLLKSGCPPGLILLDLMMPVMDGMQFREAQISDPKLAGIPVIVMSAHPKAKEIMESIHAQAYLKKPVEIQSILETVELVSPWTDDPANTEIPH